MSTSLVSVRDNEGGRPYATATSLERAIAKQCIYRTFARHADPPCTSSLPPMNGAKAINLSELGP